MDPIENPEKDLQKRLIEPSRHYPNSINAQDDEEEERKELYDDFNDQKILVSGQPEKKLRFQVLKPSSTMPQRLSTSIEEEQRNREESRVRRSNSLSRRKSMYQVLRDRLSNVHDIDWEQAQGQRSLTVAEESITFKDNRIQTSRYTPLSFLPLNLYEQFSKVSNVYFLIMGLLQMIPQITNSSSIPTVYLPLLFILFVAALKDLLEDLKRHSSDSQENQSISHKAIKIPEAQMRMSSRLSLGGSGRFLDVYSESLLVGAVIKIRQNEMIPADVVLLRSSDPKGSVFVETKNLDGETNLKPKYVQKQVLNQIYPTDLSLLTKKVKVNYEGPNPQLYSFTGNIQEVRNDGKRGERITLDEKNILLRGCVLKNTKWAYCVVVYTGHETKIMLNSHTADIKQSGVEQKMSKYILYVCALQFAFCFFAAIYDAIWYAVKKNELSYLFIEDDDILNKWALSILVSSGIWLMSILNFVPIALLVSLEMIRFLQAMLISNEKLMMSYNGFYPTVQSSNLNEDLGQIQCIFSDKTGTLTCNIMNFKCLYVDGKSYGSLKTEANTAAKSLNPSTEMNPVTNVNFQDEQFIGYLNQPSVPSPITDALLHLSLCHSVILSEKDHSLEDQNQMNQIISDKIQGKVRDSISGQQQVQEMHLSNDIQPISQIQLTNPKNERTSSQKNLESSNSGDSSKNNRNSTIIKDYEYQAASPDDLALVNFAKYTGYEYQGADGKDIITIFKHNKKYYQEDQGQSAEEQGGLGICLKYQLYHTLEFNSDRKRMSVIIKDLQNDRIVILTKGADSIILGRINEEKYKKTEEGKKLISDLQQTLEEYAKIGLRTLLLGQKSLTEEEFNDWNSRYNSALAAMTNREERVAELQNEIESNLEIVAATAIEDRLQDQVESTISILKEAGILFWILTGDKKETAINIGLSTKVLEKTDTILSIDHQSEQEPLSIQMTQMEKRISQKQPGEIFCLVVTGEMLTEILESSELSNQLIRIGSKSKSVIACRVSPKQKKDVVTIYRNSPEGKGKRTLAIGDGANDVNMITEAHVGVGIKGLEGMQAARSSDYAIGEFKILKRLLLFHGRECYRRNSTVILFNFYKNAMYLTPLLYFGFSSGFSGANLYDIYIFQMFNALFTAFPIIAYAVLDKNLSSKVLVKCPHLYKTGMDGSFLNGKELMLWFFQGFFHAALIYVVTMFTLDSQIDNQYIADLTQIGQVIFMLAVFIANFKVIVHSNMLYSLSIFIQILCLSLYFFLQLFANYFLNYDLYNILTRIFSSPDFYYVFLLVLVTTLLFDYSLVVYKDVVYFQQLALEFKERYQHSPLASTFDAKLKLLLNQPRTNLCQIRETLKIDYEEDAQGRAQSDIADNATRDQSLGRCKGGDDHEMQLD